MLFNSLQDLAHLNKIGAALFTDRLAGFISRVASERPEIKPLADKWPPSTDANLNP